MVRTVEVSGSDGAAVFRESPVSAAGMVGAAVSTVGSSGVTLKPAVLAGVLLKVVKTVEPVLL